MAPKSNNETSVSITFTDVQKEIHKIVPKTLLNEMNTYLNKYQPVLWSEEKGDNFNKKSSTQFFCFYSMEYSLIDPSKFKFKFS